MINTFIIITIKALNGSKFLGPAGPFVCLCYTARPVAFSARHVPLHRSGPARFKAIITIVCLLSIYTIYHRPKSGRNLYKLPQYRTASVHLRTKILNLFYTIYYYTFRFTQLYTQHSNTLTVTLATS